MRSEVRRPENARADRAPGTDFDRDVGSRRVVGQGAGTGGLSGRRQFSAIYEIERHRGALEVLLALDEHSMVTKSRLFRRVSPGPEAITRAMYSLERLGLIVGEESSNFPFGRLYRLTPQGARLVHTPLAAWRFLLPGV